MGFTLIFAVADNPLILVGVSAAIFFAIAFGYYNKRNSDITQRPHNGRGSATGAKGPSSMSTSENDVERTVGTHGTR